MTVGSVGQQEFEWREFRLREGRYKGYVGPRPTTIPSAYRIPPAWHARLKAYLLRRKLGSIVKPPDLGVFARPGALYRRPDGGVESVGLAHAGGLRWALLCLDVPAKAWAEVGRRLDVNGVPWGFWFHCRTVQQVQELLTISEAEKRPIVGVNVEAELGGILNPLTLHNLAAASGYQGQVATVLYGWVQNGVDCRPIGDWVALLEVFPQDAPELWPPTVKVHHCLEHARVQGLRKPVPLYGCYDLSEQAARRIEEKTGYVVLPGDAMPGWYDRTLLHGLYTVDDTQERWSASEWGFQTTAWSVMAA